MREREQSESVCWVSQGLRPWYLWGCDHADEFEYESWECVRGCGGPINFIWTVSLNVCSPPPFYKVYCMSAVAAILVIFTDVFHHHLHHQHMSMASVHAPLCIIVRTPQNLSSFSPLWFWVSMLIFLIWFGVCFLKWYVKLSFMNH